MQVFSDNMVSVVTINNHSLKDPGMGYILRLLAFLVAHFQCQLLVCHIPGAHNTVADILSRNKLSLFHTLHPQTNPAPTPTTSELLLLLLLEKPDSTMHHWTMLWNNIFHRG